MKKRLKLAIHRLFVKDKSLTRIYVEPHPKTKTVRWAYTTTISVIIGDKSVEFVRVWEG